MDKIDNIIAKLIGKLEKGLKKSHIIPIINKLIAQKYEKFLDIQKINDALINKDKIIDTQKFFKFRESIFRIDYPETIYFFIKGKCDYKCIFCDRSNLIAPQIYNNLELIKIALNFLNLKYIKEFYIGGDEPFGDENILEILKIIDKINKPISLLTSCSRPEIVKEALNLKNIVNIDIPIYGLDAKTQDSITGVKGSYKNSQQVIKYAKKLGKNLRMHSIIIRENMHEIDFYKNNVLFSFLLPNYYDTFNFYKNDGLSIKEIKDYFTEVNKKYDLKEYIKNYIGTQPFCAFPDEIIEKLKLNIKSYELQGSHLLQFMLRKKVDKCKGCYFENQCNGYYNVHFEIFGEDDVIPIK